MSQPVTLIGHEGSPYSRKLRAVFRYRHIPFRWVADMGPEFQNPPPLKIKLLPIVVTHDDNGNMLESATDTTPLIHRFEQEHTGRSLVPDDPAIAFLSALIEDFGDEWCTKFMFHFRWHAQQDIDWGKQYLITYINPAVAPAVLPQMADSFSKRQISRLWVVGSNAQTAPVIEAAYRRVLGILENLLEQRMFLFGNRPAAGDFGIFGQFSQLCEFDPTPMAIARAEAPRLVAWCRRMEELSGWPANENDWLDRDTVGRTLQPLLQELGRTYVPFMVANAQALMAASKEVSCEVDGVEWKQQTFPYQGKCIKALREHFTSLSEGDQRWVRELLSANQCIDLIDA